MRPTAPLILGVHVCIFAIAGFDNCLFAVDVFITNNLDDGGLIPVLFNLDDGNVLVLFFRDRNL
jgi:hypothetical protein